MSCNDPKSSKAKLLTFKRHFAWNLKLQMSFCAEIQLSSFGCQYMRTTLESSDKTKHHMSSLVVIPKNVLSEGMKKNMASSGFNLDHLKLTYRLE